MSSRYFKKGRKMGAAAARAERRGFKKGFYGSIRASRRSRYTSKVRRSMTSKLGRHYGGKARFVPTRVVKGLRASGTVRARSMRAKGY